MNPLWLAPVVVLAAGMAVILYVARDAARAARELVEGVSRFGDVRASVRDLAGEASELRASLPARPRK